MSEKLSEERDSSPVLASPKPSTTAASAPPAATSTATSADASAPPERSSKQRIQQLRERLAQYNTSIAENLSGASGATTTTATTTARASASAGAAAAAAEVPTGRSSPTQRLARNLSAEFNRTESSPPPPPPPRGTTSSTTRLSTSAASPVRRVSESSFSAAREAASSRGDAGSPLRHAPQPITPKMMADITTTAATTTSSTAASASTSTASAAAAPGQNTASQTTGSTTTTTSTFRPTSTGTNPFQAEPTDIRRPRQRASVDMMEEAVRRSSTASTEAAIRAAQQEAFSGGAAKSGSAVRSSFSSQRPSFTTRTTSTAAVPPQGARFSPSPYEPAMNLATSSSDDDVETEEEEEEESEYEEVEFDVEEIEEEFEETDTSDDDYDDDDDDEEDDEEAVNAFLQELLEKDDFIRGAVEKTLAQSGQTAEDSRTMNPLIRRAAELYRQRRQNQHQSQSPKQPLLPARQLHLDAAVKDPAKPLVDTDAVVAAAAKAPATGPFSSERVTEALARGGPVRFGDLETAYCHIIATQLGAEKVYSRLRLEAFPQPLPKWDEAETFTTRRDELFQSLQQLCHTPATQRQLGDLRQTEAVAVNDKCAAFIAVCQERVHGKALKVVEDQQAVVLGKERLLAERQKDLEERRVACRAVREEMLKMKRRNATRAAQLTAREATYAQRLEEHNTMEAATQSRVAEVEQLTKKVTWWLRVLDERNTTLTQKEERLQAMEADVARRRADLRVFQSARAQNTGKNQPPLPPPPPPPPRTNQEKRY